MAATVNTSDEHVHKVHLKVLVDKQKNKVLFAEAGKDFVDVLLSFLTLPLGTIARLLAQDSNIKPVRVGSLSSLYEGVSHLEDEHVWTQACKEMLLHPRNSMESYCQQLKLNLDDTQPMKFFTCYSGDCSRQERLRLFSIFRNQKCSRCGKLMKYEVSPEKFTLENGFVKETATFIISDDLSLFPNVLGTSVDLLRKLGVKDMDAIQEQTVDISKREVVDILKLSLLSKTPLTDFIKDKKQPLEDLNPINQFSFDLGEESSDEGRQMVLKVFVRKSNKSILFAEAEENFADFLYSFLTFPLGGVLHMLKGSSSMGCIDKLYKSMIELSSDRYLRSQELKDKLTNPVCALLFNLPNQILPIGVESLPFYYFRRFCVNCDDEVLGFCICGDDDSCCDDIVVTSRKKDTDFTNAPLNIIDPKSSDGESLSSQGFIKGPSMYMVTDDLVVTQMSSASVVLYLNKLKVPLFDLEERVITIGVKEALAILKASLTSAFALTNGLKQFTTAIKSEN